MDRVANQITEFEIAYWSYTGCEGIYKVDPLNFKFLY